MLMASLLRALVTVASTSPAMASSMTFFTYWKAASPPRAVAPKPKGLGFSGSPGMSEALRRPRTNTSMTPYS